MIASEGVVALECKKREPNETAVANEQLLAPNMGPCWLPSQGNLKTLCIRARRHSAAVLSYNTLQIVLKWHLDPR